MAAMSDEWTLLTAFCVNYQGAVHLAQAFENFFGRLNH